MTKTSDMVTATVKTPQYFLQNVDSGEPAYHCGNTPAEAAEGAKQFIMLELAELWQGFDGGTVALELSRVDMTHEEVADIPVI